MGLILCSMLCLCVGMFACAECSAVRSPDPHRPRHRPRLRLQGGWPRTWLRHGFRNALRSNSYRVPDTRLAIACLQSPPA